MLDYLEKIKHREFDCLMFMPGPKEHQIQVEGNCYRDPGEPVDKSDLGHSWHILLYKHDKETDDIIDVDLFDAILACPLEYISGLIPNGWYGIVARKTTTSEKFINVAFDKLTEE